MAVGLEVVSDPDSVALGDGLVDPEVVSDVPEVEVDGDGAVDSAPLGDVDVLEPEAVPVGDDVVDPDPVAEDVAAGDPVEVADAVAVGEAVDDASPVTVPGWSSSMIARICALYPPIVSATSSTGTSPREIASPYSAICCHTASSSVIASSDSGPSRVRKSCWASA